MESFESSVSEICVKWIRVNQGVGVQKTCDFISLLMYFFLLSRCKNSFILSLKKKSINLLVPWHLCMVGTILSISNMYGLTLLLVNLGNAVNHETFWTLQIIFNCSGGVGGKTGKTSVLPVFSKIEHGGGSSGTRHCYCGLT